MQLSRRARLVAAVVLMAAATVAAYVRALPLEPHLEISVKRMRKSETFALYDLRIRSRGGEVLDDLHIEVLRGPVGLVPPRSVQGLAPGSTFATKVTASGVTDVPPAIRVVQQGRVSRTYDVDLEEWRVR